MTSKFLLSCLLACGLLLPAVSQARQCTAGMILVKTPDHPEGDCIPYRGKKVRMDITQGTSKVGKSTETYLKPSNDNGPRSVQSKYLQLWLDATDPFNDGYRPADGRKMSRWKDKSGNSHDAVQATVASQPTYIVNNINGLPAVLFDGAPYRMTMGGGVLNKFTDQVTIFIVYKASTVSFGAFLQSNPRNEANNFAVQLTASAGNGLMTNWYYGNGSSYGGGGDGSLRIDGGTNDPTIVSLVSSPAPSALMDVYYRGGRVMRQGTYSTVSFTSATSLDIGPGYYGGLPYSLVADIGEIIIYNKALTSNERRDIEQYLANKWSIKLADQEVLTTPLLVLDAQNDATINYSGTPLQDDLVGIWKDVSGYDNHAAGYETSRPIYKDGTTNPAMGINGHPALYFTGSAEADKVTMLDGTEQISSMLTIWPKIMEKFSTAMTAFIVGSTPSNVGASVLTVGNGSGMAMFLPAYEATYTNRDNIIWYVGGDSAVPVPWTATYGQAYVWAFRNSTTIASEGVVAGKQIYQDGVNVPVNDPEADYTAEIHSPMQFKQTDPLRIAGPFWGTTTWKGYLGEIRMYNRRLTDVEMCSCNKYLQNKWGIAVEPTDCPLPPSGPPGCKAANASSPHCACP